MAFTSKQERKFGATNPQTKEAVGPGSYLGTSSMMMSKKRISVKEPFASMVDRHGKNAQSWQNLHGVKILNENPSLPPFHEQIVQKNQQANMEAHGSSRHVPGPGHYEVTIGFEKIHQSMK